MLFSTVEMSAKELETELEQLRKDTLKCKQEFYLQRDKIHRMSQEYEDSKKYNPTQRYTVLKTVIKNVTK